MIRRGGRNGSGRSLSRLRRHRLSFRRFRFDAASAGCLQISRIRRSGHCVHRRRQRLSSRRCGRSRRIAGDVGFNGGGGRRRTRRSVRCVGSDISLSGGRRCRCRRRRLHVVVDGRAGIGAERHFILLDDDVVARRHCAGRRRGNRLCRRRFLQRLRPRQSQRGCRNSKLSLFLLFHRFETNFLANV